MQRRIMAKYLLKTQDCVQSCSLIMKSGDKAQLFQTLATTMGAALSVTQLYCRVLHCVAAVFCFSLPLNHCRATAGLSERLHSIANKDKFFFRETYLKRAAFPNETSFTHSNNCMVEHKFVQVRVVWLSRYLGFTLQMFWQIRIRFSSPLLQVHGWFDWTGREAISQGENLRVRSRWSALRLNNEVWNSTWTHDFLSVHAKTHTQNSFLSSQRSCSILSCKQNSVVFLLFGLCGSESRDISWPPYLRAASPGWTTACHFGIVELLYALGSIDLLDQAIQGACVFSQLNPPNSITQGRRIRRVGGRDRTYICCRWKQWRAKTFFIGLWPTSFQCVAKWCLHEKKFDGIESLGGVFFVFICGSHVLCRVQEITRIDPQKTSLVATASPEWGSCPVNQKGHDKIR